MMLPEGHGLNHGHPELRGYIRFVNLDTGALVRAHLPLFGDHSAMDSVDGLLVLLRDHDSAVRLLHPFTGDIAELPPLATLLPQLATRMSCPVPSIKRLAGIVRASASFSDGAITIMLALHQVHHVAFASTLDRQWTLSSWKYQMGSSPPLPFRGKLYLARTVISRDDVQIFQIDTPVKDETGSGCVLLPPKLIATLPKGNIINPTRMVECDSEILVLGYKDWYLLQILVFKLTDLVLQMCIPITSIGGNTFFISERSITVGSKVLPTAMGDNVVCIHSRRQSLVQYHLVSGTWSPAADDCSMYGPAPGLCCLVHHIFSSCILTR